MRIPLVSRLLLLLVAAALAGGSIDATNAGSDVPGDVNCDNELTVVDPLELLKAGAGLPANDDCAPVNADYTCDDAAGVADVPQLLRLIAGLDAESCVPAGTSADGLIDDALARGEITSDEAILFKLYYVFADDRLPSEFDVLDDTETSGTSIMKEIAEQYDSLSPQMQQQVGPYLVPPYYVGSWWDLQQQGASAAPQGVPPCIPRPFPEDCPGHPDWSSQSGTLVKVWYPSDLPNGAAQAFATIHDIESEFWPKLEDLLQVTPISDQGQSNNGGDGLLDIAIRPGEVTLNYAASYSPGDCSAVPSYIGIIDEVASAVAFEIMIHELMHAFQFTFDIPGSGMCGEWDWVAEGTASWAIKYIRPQSTIDHDDALGFLQRTEYPITSTEQRHEYGSWIFFYYLSQTNSPDIIRQIWFEGTTQADSLIAVNNVIPGGWEERWPEFSLYNWNRPPLDYYNQWTNLDWQLSGDPSVEIKLGPNGEMRYDATNAVPIDYLSAVYYHFRIAPEVRSIGIHNGLANNLVEYTTESGTIITPDLGGDVKGLHIWLLAKVDGVWQEPLDWTNYPAAYYCRQVPEERVEEVVLIATNDEFHDRNYKIEPQGLPITVQATDIGCDRWEGTITQTEDGNGWHETLIGEDLVFERYPAQVSIYYGAHVNYLLVSGSFDWELDATQGECTYTGSASGLTPELDRIVLQTYNHWLPGLYHRAIAGSMNIEELQPYTVNCSGNPPEQAERFVGVSFPLSLTPLQVAPGGNVTSGTSTEGDITVTWHLESAP